MEIYAQNAIQLLTEKIGDCTTPDEALKFTQAALNLAHTSATIDRLEMEIIKFKEPGVVPIT